MRVSDVRDLYNLCLLVCRLLYTLFIMYTLNDELSHLCPAAVIGALAVHRESCLNYGQRWRKTLCQGEKYNDTHPPEAHYIHM